MKLPSFFLLLSLTLFGCREKNVDANPSDMSDRDSDDGDSDSDSDGDDGDSDSDGDGDGDGDGNGDGDGDGDGVINLPPESVIESPLAVTTIAQGQSLSFSGSCSDPEGDTTFTYAWDFDGVTEASTQKAPGEVQFDELGSYAITFTCSDSQGLADSSPASALVIVRNQIVVTTTNDELNDDEQCSLREAVQAANTDTEVSGCNAGSGWDLIEVAEGSYLLELVGDEDLNATGDLDILESLTLVGAGSSKTSIDGNNADRLLHVHQADPGIHFELTGVELTHGAALTGAAVLIESGQTTIGESLLNSNQATNSGGALQLMAGSLGLHSVTLAENQVTDSAVGNGGAIYNEAGILRIEDSLISSNTAYDGAGIYSAKGSVWLRASQVLANVNATDDDVTHGGGIYVDNGSLHLQNNSEVAQHISADEGGGLYLTENSLFTMSDSSIHDNQAKVAGGGIYGLMKAASFSRSSINDNKALPDASGSVGGGPTPPVPDGDGGGIYFKGGQFIFEESELRDNEAGEGGGVYQDSDDGAVSTLIVRDSTVSGNHAFKGGGIYKAEDVGAGIYLIRSIIRENSADNEGGSLYMGEYGGLYAEDSSFTDNSASQGGALYLYAEGGISLDRCSFSGNQARTDGGALYLYAYVLAEIRNSTFSENVAQDEGGAIYLHEQTADIQFTTITNNSAGVAGGGVYSKFFIALQNNIIAGNSVGASLTADSADCQIDEALFSGGHNLFGFNTGCAATRYDLTIAGDEVATKVLGPLMDNGGAALSDGTHPLTHALLSGSPAVDAAWSEYCLAVDQTGTARALGNACDIGAIESSQSAVIAEAVHNLIQVNTIDDELNSDGDCSLREAIEAANTDEAVDDCAAGDGWDLVQVPAGTYLLSIGGNEEDENQSGDLDILQPLTLRGASAATTIIDANKIDRVLDVRNAALRATDLSFKNGHSPGDGGCLQNDEGSLTLTNTEISKGKSDDDGAGIYSDYGVLHIYDSSIHDNIALSSNGGVFNSEGLMTIQGSKVFNNSALNYGGGVMSYGAATRLSNVEIYGNELGKGLGAGIFHGSGVAVIENNSVIRDNQLNVSTGVEPASFDGGGGISVDDGAMLIKDSIISNNQSETRGGGINADGGLWVFNTTIENNTAVLEGGGIKGNGIFENTTIQGNAGAEGGGIYGSGIIAQSTVNENTAASGGGLYARGLLISETEIVQNEANVSHGGGLYLTEGGGACISESNIAQNKAPSGIFGAGIFVEASNAALVLEASSITSHAGVESGAGLYNLGVADVINSTLSGNSAVSGAGIYNGSGGTLSLLQCTVANNSALSGSGGGLTNEGTAVLSSTIIAGNSANESKSDPAADCQLLEPMTSAGFNLAGESTGCTLELSLDQSIATDDVFSELLAPLGENTKGTFSHSLVTEAAAVDQAPCVITFDQVGTERPQGSLCDIGAVEELVSR